MDRKQFQDLFVNRSLFAAKMQRNHGIDSPEYEVALRDLAEVISDHSAPPPIIKITMNTPEEDAFTIAMKHIDTLSAAMQRAIDTLGDSTEAFGILSDALTDLDSATLLQPDTDPTADNAAVNAVLTASHAAYRAADAKSINRDLLDIAAAMYHTLHHTHSATFQNILDRAAPILAELGALGDEA